LVRNDADLNDLVATAGRILYRLGMVDYLGHVSARGSDGIVIKPKHSPTVRGMNQLAADQLIRVGFDGRLLEGAAQPPAEVFIHTAIYAARPDVNAIVHTHQHSATLMGILDEPIKPVLHIPSSYVVPPDIGLWPSPVLVTDSVLGADLARALGQRTFCHLQGHGIVAVGATVQEAVVNAVMLEESARANLDILATGREPREITAAEIDELRRFRAPVAGRWAYFESLLDHARAH
jgi:ribulose-5-phosphate 4-epimerase/fuculose-1-phosphate aldolase